MSGYGLGILVEETEPYEDSPRSIYKDLSSLSIQQTDGMVTPDAVGLLPPLPDDGSHLDSLHQRSATSISLASLNSQLQNVNLHHDDFEDAAFGPNSRLEPDHSDQHLPLQIPHDSEIDSHLPSFIMSQSHPLQSPNEYPNASYGTTTKQNSMNMKKLKNGIKSLGLTTHKIPTSSANTSNTASRNNSLSEDFLLPFDADSDELSRKNAPIQRNVSSVTTPITPPLASPIITLTEKFNRDDTVSQVDQSFLFYNSPKTAPQKQVDENVDILSTLNNEEELRSYLTYLTNQKLSIIEAFNLTENRLVESGWFSNNDLADLKLKKINSQKKLEDKIMRTELKLSSLEHSESSSSFTVYQFNTVTSSHRSINSNSRQRSSIASSMISMPDMMDGDLPSPDLKKLEAKFLSENSL